MVQPAQFQSLLKKKLREIEIVEMQESYIFLEEHTKIWTETESKNHLPYVYFFLSGYSRSTILVKLVQRWSTTVILSIKTEKGKLCSAQWVSTIICSPSVVLILMHFLLGH